MRSRKTGERPVRPRISQIRDLVVMHDGQPLGMITASVGVAGLPEHGLSQKDLLQAVDAALYRAKREGRDRVVVVEAIPKPDSQTNSTGMAASKS